MAGKTKKLVLSQSKDIAKLNARIFELEEEVQDHKDDLNVLVDMFFELNTAVSNMEKAFGVTRAVSPADTEGSIPAAKYWGFPTC